MDQAHTENGIVEQFRIEFIDFWYRLPNKGFFFVLLAAWLALFQWLGSSTLGYVATSSLFAWMYDAYTLGGRQVEGMDDAVGLFVLPVVLGLMWWKRRELMAQRVVLWWPALALLALGLVFHLIGYLVQQPRASVIGLFTGIYGLTGLAWGPGWLRASFFPFFLFGFCVPLGSLAEPITFRLRLLVTQLVEIVCHYLLMIDVLREGTALRDPTNQYSYEVAAACSGIRSLVMTLGMAVILAFVSLKAWWRRGVMILSAFPLAVLGNLLRMLCIVVAAEYWGPEAGDRVHKDAIISLLPYVPVFVGLLWLEGWLGRSERRQSAKAPPSGDGGRIESPELALPAKAPSR